MNPGMRWKRSSTSQVQDRRGSGGSGGFGGMRGALGGGGIPIPIGGGLSGIVIFVIFLVILVLSNGGLGSGPTGGIGGLGGGNAGDGVASSLDPNDDTAQFINAVTVDVQTFWDERFTEAGKDYTETLLVLFSDQTTTGCGVGSSATGPFYCPLDDTVYLDASFFEALESRFGAPGDFAEAYVIAHEFGHHVQDELGILDSTHQQMEADPANANELSIRLELQADCLAGVWANSIWKDPDNANVESITQEDVQEGLAAAAAVGDDRIQEQASGRVDRESWTHGSSEQRMHWFQAGFDQGTTEACDTFTAASS
jgi:hypothetical protein